MAEARVEQWKRKVLDLSLRNPLLNARDCAKFLPLNEGTPYDGGAATTEIVPYSASETGDALPFNSHLPEKEIKRRLKELYLAGRAMFSESGVNSLFVAIGFLNWREGEKDDYHHAPLVLIPVQLVRQTASPGYRAQRTDEDAVVNFCLVELLRSQFNLSVPEVEGGGFGDGDPNYNEVFRNFADAIRTKRDWSISTGVALGIFSFSKVVIWKDLVANFDAFCANPFVKHLAEGSKQPYDDGVKVFPPEEVEQHIRPEKLFCPLAADSSQITAVLYSELGKSFVLHGPPGTGKSQTIANIIAHNLALGKRVLFVSEKKAALDVVYGRLSSVGLAPFCLELHSNKADKANVMRQFAEAMAVTPTRGPAHWSTTCSSVRAAVDELGAYARELHAPCANGLSAYDCLARHGERHPQADATLVSLRAADVSHDELIALGRVVRELAEEWKDVDKPDYEALKLVPDNDWTPQFEGRVAAQAAALLDALREPNKLKRFFRVAVQVLRGACTRTIEYPRNFDVTEDSAAVQAVRDHLGGLRRVLSYRAHRRAAVKAKCAKFVEALEAGRFTSDEAARVFEDSCVEKALNTLVSRSKVLSGFSGQKQEERIARFRELDATYTRDVQKTIVAILSRRRDAIDHPAPVKGKDGKTITPELDPELKRELALLRHECEKKKRFMPPRQLLAETKSVAMKLKPCFLMSPLSVAQYLPIEGDLFDLVVFDEASQMTVWDAVGVIARGRQLVVVGDPKQLPPTNFFVKGDVKDENREDDPETEDLESILDECLGNSLHSAYLNWHYRSRHESLISFSNRHYYGERLNTFPAALTNERLGVSFRCVEGARYDHASHTNRCEAEAIVDYLFARLNDPAERRRSWGIVTFSVAQQHLIESLIDKVGEKFDWANDFFDDARADAFFVKNLENVQGDERDVIMFSIAYAPDDKGRFAMSFGPVNRPGGERRLNVAITRAREQAVLFASVHGSDIHAERSNSQGVRDLRDLLVYAEGQGGVDAPCPPPAAASALTDVPCPPGGIRKLVCACLAANGYAYVTDVGMSAYPIDIAVCDPREPGRYILGIECDGPKYASQQTVRDRDILRPDVLQSLGWKLCRAWSVDWAFDRKRAEERLLAELRKQTQQQRRNQHDIHR